jgi:peptidoglycan/xylan/chitin deacetylase (PgdA/CDA1 family)
MNILSFDTEEWALAKAGGFGTADKYAEYDSFLNNILDLLDFRRIKATFFCTGLLAADFPQVVKLISSRGHEIGCHSHSHTWMNKLSENQAREDTRCAVDSLEQCVGKKIQSYRAPAFSIGNNNKWMSDILAENGICRDASIYPAERDFGGFPGFGVQTPCLIEYNGISFKEFPVCLTSFLGKEVAYSGGGYFRFFPLWFVEKQMKKSSYAMCYFHIDDLLKETNCVRSKEDFESYYKEPGTLKNRYVRYFKANVGKKNAWIKLVKLIENMSFCGIEEADNKIDWENTPVVKL